MTLLGSSVGCSDGFIVEEDMVRIHVKIWGRSIGGS